MNQNRSILDIPIFHKTYSLYKTLNTYHGSIPKSHRYTLWQKCENSALSLLELVMRTSYQKGEQRVAALREMSHQLDLLKVLIRLAKETRTLSSKQYITIELALQEIGKMVGGWLKSLSH